MGGAVVLAGFVTKCELTGPGADVVSPSGYSVETGAKELRQLPPPTPHRISHVLLPKVSEGNIQNSGCFSFRAIRLLSLALGLRSISANPLRGRQAP
jgi:hypothetical protein